jgi:hypothetical protein
VHDSLSIPPDLDRALAMTVLETTRVRGEGTTPSGAAVAAILPQLDSVLERVVRALVTAGATRDEVLDALQDAFAALLAAREGDPRREALLELDEHARATARRLLQTVAA